MTHFTIVAECGVNHGGEMANAIAMINKAKMIGCDAVKFQYYDTHQVMVYEDAHPPSKYTFGMFQAIVKMEFSLDQLWHLKHICDSDGIEFMCTPFIDPQKVDDLNGLVKRWKIRERDSKNMPLITRAVRTGKPAYMSKFRLDWDFGVLPPPNLSYLYCIPKYPAGFEDLNLDQLGGYAGYSNHVPSLAAPLATAAVAILNDAPEWMVEVHVMLARGKGAIDEAVSFDFDELGWLVKSLREMEKCPKPLIPR